MKRSFVHAFGWILIGWAAALCILVCVVGQTDAGMFSDSMIIAVASVAIACASMLPGLLTRGGSRAHAQGQGSGLAAGLFAGILIRLVGTVALFLTCRYHMASTTEMIAGMTIGWYLLLTSIEVFVLVRELPKPDANLAATDAPTPVKS